MEDTQFRSETATEIEAELSSLLHALRCLRRRQVVGLLNSGPDEGSVSTRWLARQIAGKENGVAPVLATSQQYKNVYNALSQTHLPTLSEANIIVYDPQRQEVSSGPELILGKLLLNLIEPVVKTFCT
jgi:hypothetical protein